jgi:glycosyltransferase involved in cell wall biosynthesis
VLEPELTLIIATYNGRRFLREAISSVLGERLGSFELLLVDDGSTDGTLQSVADLPITVLRREKNRGTAAAYNFALSRAKGRYIAFLDHDDVICPGSLTARLDWLKANPEAPLLRGVVAGVIDGEGKILGSYDDLFDGPKEELPRVIVADYLRESLRAGKPFLCAPWLHLYRSDFLRELGPFDESLKVAHDIEHLLRVVNRTAIPVEPIPTMYYRMHHTNTSGTLMDGAFHAHRRTIAESSLVLWSYGYEP